LACYFHDLGLLVSREEFDHRDRSNFRNFCENVLFSGPEGGDYHAKVNELDPLEGEKLLYQEFVRYNHAARVRGWILGKADPTLGSASAAAAEVDRLLKPLDMRVRVDLANICESHNLNDLDDELKYPLFQPYGGTEDETVNLQYAAAILRTTDLIQITRQRAPTVLFRFINPTDPISQIEWLKQNAVRHIRAKPQPDRSGEVTRTIQSDTIEVYADFKRAEGFFGLTAYLRYAEKELQRSHGVIESSKKKSEKKYSFPWRYIDDTHVNAEGFLPQQYEFELDQARILDLLTGHTLYNDSDVVIRELAQNAIDAVRLQAQEEDKSSEREGKVQILWNSEDSLLEVVDNGTGMTQEIIERHLLKVGSSRYQDQKFKELHPNFSPISRFGIGVLSAFMVADIVDIVTCTQAEEKARQISLRSVHGKYLIRLLDKESDVSASRLVPHGTSIKLKLRPSARRVDVVETVRRWIMFPRCSVTVQIDSESPVTVGFDSPRAALENYLSSHAPPREVATESYRVEERTLDGVTLAYALRYNPFFKDWAFMGVSANEEREGNITVAATCVEGIMVERRSPGFIEGGLLAIANATGKDSPKTNVARSSLEDTEGRTAAIQKVYDLYVAQLDNECRRLISEEGYPLSRVVNQLPYIVTQLQWEQEEHNVRYRGDSLSSHPELLRRAFSKLPVFLVEKTTERSAATLNEVKEFGRFWTVEAPLMFSVEQLIREMPVDITARSILRFAQGHMPELPPGPIISNLNTRLARASVEGIFEIKGIRAIEVGHRLELEWGNIGERPIWVSQSALAARLRRTDPQTAYQIFNVFEERYEPVLRAYQLRAVQGNILLCNGQLPVEGLTGFSAIRALQGIYFLPGSKFLEALLPAFDSRQFNEIARAYIYLEIIRRLVAAEPNTPPATQEVFDRATKLLVSTGVDAYLPDIDEARQSVCEVSWRTYDPFAWSREKF